MGYQTSTACYIPFFRQVREQMALLDILRFPDKRLRQKAQQVEHIDEKIEQIVADMFETMYQFAGIGLAAIQVNIKKSIIVMDLSPEKNQPECFINLKILEKKGQEKYEEGCLSVPGIYEEVTRAHWIKYRALNQQGETIEAECTGLNAICLQHELDHLNGKLFTDYVSALKLKRARRQLLKDQKE